jgi:hypothetical protein
MRRGSVRKGAAIYACAPGRADGARAEDWYGEVWKAHWHGSRPSEALEIQHPHSPV